MKDKKKTKKQSTNELKHLRRRIAELEALETKHKQAEEALQKASEELKKREAQYRTLVANVDLGISLINADHTILMATAAEGIHFNKPLNNFIGKKCFREFEKRDAVCPHCPGVLAMATGQPAAVETEAVQDDGTHYNVRIQAFPTFGHDGMVTGFMEIYENITERKKIEEALCQTAEKFRIITSTAMDGFAEIDLDGRILDVNEESCRMIGYNRDEQLKMSILDIEAIETRDATKRRIKRIIKTGSDRFESRLRHKDGHIIDIEVSSTFVPQTGHLLVFHRDITERKRTEEALRESEEKFRNLAEQSPNMIFINAKGRIVYVNEKCTEITGYTREEFYSPDFDFWTLIAPESIDLIKELYGKHMTGEDVPPYEYTLITKAGRRIETINATKLITYGGEHALLGIVTDITDRKQAEDALQHSYQQLRETFIETVNALASTVEMKDPYTAGHQRWATRLACAIAKEMGLSEERIEGIRMAGLIHDIGKINIPAEILSKPGHLSEIQYNMVKIHPQVGCDILREIKFPWPVAQIVLQHHERMDGSGYPQGLSGKEIILEARILAVADAVEAMSSHRPYRPAHGIEKALEEISQYKGTLYDPEVVDACLKIFEKGFRFD